MVMVVLCMLHNIVTQKVGLILTVAYLLVHVAYFSSGRFKEKNIFYSSNDNKMPWDLRYANNYIKCFIHFFFTYILWPKLANAQISDSAQKSDSTMA